MRHEKRKGGRTLQKLMFDNAFEALRESDRAEALGHRLQRSPSFMRGANVTIMRQGWRHCVDLQRNVQNNYALVGTLLFSVLLPLVFEPPESAEGPALFGWDRERLLMGYYVSLMVSVVSSFGVFFAPIVYMISTDGTVGNAIFDAESFLYITVLAEAVPYYCKLLLTVSLLPTIALGTCVANDAPVAQAACVTLIICVMLLALPFGMLVHRIRCNGIANTKTFEARTQISVGEIARQAWDAYQSDTTMLSDTAQDVRADDTVQPLSRATPGSPPPSPPPPMKVLATGLLLPPWHGTNVPCAARSVEARLLEAGELLRRDLISEGEYESARARILLEL